MKHTPNEYYNQAIKDAAELCRGFVKKVAEHPQTSCSAAGGWMVVAASQLADGIEKMEKK